MTPRSPFDAGLRAGLVAASATAGALLAFGLRLGTPLRPFNAIARLVLGRSADGVWGWVPAITVPGLLVHIALGVVCGLALALLAPARARLPRLVAIATLIAGAAHLLDAVLLPRVAGPGLAALLAPAQLVLFYLVLIGGLVAGIRLAFSSGARG